MFGSVSCLTTEQEEITALCPIVPLTVYRRQNHLEEALSPSIHWWYPKCTFPRGSVP